jgi:hypothetical protein
MKLHYVNVTPILMLHLSYVLTRRHSPFREADSASADQEVPCFLWNMKACYSV